MDSLKCDFTRLMTENVRSAEATDNVSTTTKHADKAVSREMHSEFRIIVGKYL